MPADVRGTSTNIFRVMANCKSPRQSNISCLCNWQAPALGYVPAYVIDAS